jgi:hypothetical protein
MGDKGEWWREWIQLWYTIRTFVNVTMYSQYNNNMIIKNKEIKLDKANNNKKVPSFSWLVTARNPRSLPRQCMLYFFTEKLHFFSFASL